MASREFNPWDIWLQLETDMRRGAEAAMRAVAFRPGVDMYETKEALVIKMELAGVSPENLHLTLSADDRILTISGERAEYDEEGIERLRHYQLEIFFGTFQREIALPPHLPLDRERIAARYQDGFLIISLPKRSGSASEKRVIPVSQE